MKWIDLPPVWLAAAMAVVWIGARMSPVAAVFAPYTRPLGVIVIAAGLILMMWSVWTMMRYKTTVIPHRSASALVTSGPFSISRNPIYLADAMILAGWALMLGAVVGLLLVPAFVFTIKRRFILGEEARLRASFGREFEEWSSRVRRWI